MDQNGGDIEHIFHQLFVLTEGVLKYFTPRSHVIPWNDDFLHKLGLPRSFMTVSLYQTC